MERNKTIIIGILVFVGLLFLMSTYYLVSPGNRGILVTLGKTDLIPKKEGVGFKAPFITKMIEVSIRQQTEAMKAECYSSDLQQVSVDLKVLYRIPEDKITLIFTQYAGNPFDSLLAPRLQEALKEATAQESAESIVKNRELIKMKVLESARKKMQGILVIEDVVIENVALSSELEKAIEEKMVQEQEAAKSKFLKEKARVEAETAEIRATGEARAIEIRGEAIRKNPAIIDLQMVEKWNGVSPLAVGTGSGSFILPLDKKPGSVTR